MIPSRTARREPALAQGRREKGRRKSPAGSDGDERVLSLLSGQLGLVKTIAIPPLEVGWVCGPESSFGKSTSARILFKRGKRRGEKILLPLY